MKKLLTKFTIYDKNFSIKWVQREHISQHDKAHL